MIKVFIRGKVSFNTSSTRNASGSGISMQIYKPPQLEHWTDNEQNNFVNQPIISSMCFAVIPFYD